MRRIEQFKNAEVKVAIRTGDRVSMSLVGAKAVQKGNQPAMYTYGDGRTCRHSDGEFHDCAYVDARNRLIPEAERACYAQAAGAEDAAGMLRMRTFFANMDRLWAEWKERR